MKGEYREDKDHPHHTTTMFSKFNHHHHNHHPPPPPQQHFAISGHHHFHRPTNSSSEADSRSSPTHTTTHTPTPTKKDSTTTNDGASIEVTRRPRGRPPGSKNKPKPPVIITREPDPSMSPYVLELPGDTDIIHALISYTRKRNMGLCILTGSGTVVNVSLRQPSTTAASGATVTFHGRFDILSLSATILPSSSAVVPGFTISLAGPQGQIVGGAVAGGLMSAGTVYVIAASFNNPLYHRLPDDQEDDDVRNSGGGAGSSEQSPAAGGDSGHLAAAADTMSMFSGHLNSSDVIWAPTPRQAQPHPPPY